MQNDPASTPKLPEVGDLFFAVCFSAIQNTSWKRSDFDKVAFVEGQLQALREYFLALKRPVANPEAAKMAQDTTPAPIVPPATPQQATDDASKAPVPENPPVGSGAPEVEPLKQPEAPTPQPVAPNPEEPKKS